MSDNEQQKPGRKTATSAPAAAHEYGAPADAAPAAAAPADAPPSATTQTDANRATQSGAAPEFAAAAAHEPPLRAEAANGAAGSGDGANDANSADGQDLAERKMQYLITPRRNALGALGAGPFGPHGPDMGRIYEALTVMNNITVVRHIRPSNNIPTITAIAVFIATFENAKIIILPEG